MKEARTEVLLRIHTPQTPTKLLVLPAGQGCLVALTEQDQGRRGDQLWSKRVWSGG